MLLLLHWFGTVRAAEGCGAQRGGSLRTQCGVLVTLRHLLECALQALMHGATGADVRHRGLNACQACTPRLQPKNMSGLSSSMIQLQKR